MPDYTISQAARTLNLSAQTITVWCRTGALPGAYQLPGMRIRRWRIPAATIDAIRSAARKPEPTVAG